jgi:hypothetical protein
VVWAHKVPLGRGKPSPGLAAVEMHRNALVRAMSRSLPAFVMIGTLQELDNLLVGMLLVGMQKLEVAVE